MGTFPLEARLFFRALSLFLVERGIAGPTAAVLPIVRSFCSVYRFLREKERVKEGIFFYTVYASTEARSCCSREYNIVDIPEMPLVILLMSMDIS